MAWRASHSLAVRSFLRLPVEDPPPDHSTISRTRRVIDLESHRAVFTWVQQRLVAAGLLRGKTVAIDALFGRDPSSSRQTGPALVAPGAGSVDNLAVQRTPASSPPSAGRSQSAVLLPAD